MIASLPLKKTLHLGYLVLELEQAFEIADGDAEQILARKLHRMSFCCHRVKQVAMRKPGKLRIHHLLHVREPRYCVMAMVRNISIL